MQIQNWYTKQWCSLTREVITIKRNVADCNNRALDLRAFTSIGFTSPGQGFVADGNVIVNTAC